MIVVAMPKWLQHSTSLLTVDIRLKLPSPPPVEFSLCRNDKAR
jgi:hypothetical protein